MSSDQPTVVEAGDRVGIGVEVGDAHVAAILPEDASPRDIIRATGRLETEARNEIAFRKCRAEPEDVQETEDIVRDGDREESEDIVQEQDPEDQEDPPADDTGTKYGHLIGDGGGQGVLIQPARGETDPDQLLEAVDRMIQDSDVIRRDGVILSIEEGPELRADGGDDARDPARGGAIVDHYRENDDGRRRDPDDIFSNGAGAVDPVLVDRQVLRELVAASKGKLEGDVSTWGPDKTGYDVDRFAETIDEAEASLEGDSEDTFWTLVDELANPEDTVRRRDVETPAARLEEIARQARLLRDELELLEADVPDLASIASTAYRIQERHGLDGEAAGHAGQLLEEVDP